MVLVRADRGRYGKLIEEIENAFLKGNNDYPETPTEAYNLLVNYRNYNNNKRPMPGGLEQVAFVADGKRTKAEHITCFKCKKKGHYKSDCPELQTYNNGTVIQATTLTTIATTLSTSETSINPMWILCDSESTVDIFKNNTMLTNIRRAEKPIKLKGIEGGVTIVDREGDLLGYGKVYYHPRVTANVLSFFNISRRFKSVKYDNEVKDAFQITRDDGSIMEFKPSDSGLYFYNFEESKRRQQLKQEQEQNKEDQAMVINTIEEIKRNFTRREIEAAESARRMYVIMGRPGRQTFETMLKKGMIINNPVTVQDYRNALSIYGEDLGVLKGKTVRQKQNHVKIETDIKPKVKQEHIVLAVDLLYFTGLTFLITVSRNIRFITATMIPDRKKNTILGALKQVINLYQGRGHKLEGLEFNVDENVVHTILADNEFQTLREDVEELGITVNTVAKDEHVPEVERQNRVIKERARAIVQTLPYQRIPKKMRIAMIHYVVYWLNNIPKEEQAESPRDLIFGEYRLEYKTVCQLPFGSYVQVHDEVSQTNTMEPRTTGAINLGPTGNVQGAHKFLSLVTGEVIIRCRWTELPVPSEVILRLEELAKDPNDDITMVLEDDEVIENESEESTGEPVEMAEIIEMPDVPEVPVEIQHTPADIGGLEHQMERLDEATMRTTEEQYEEEHQVNPSVEDQEADVSMTDDTVQTANGDKRKELEQRYRYNLRAKRDRDYSYRYTLLSLKSGIKRWGKRAKDAMMDELRLFLDEEVFEGLKNPTRKQMEMALRIHCFVIEKRDGRIKARAVADGKTQKRYSEEETYSPTVKLESIMLSSLIDAYEQRDVITIDIKGAFLKAKVPEDMELVVKMDEELADLFCELNPALNEIRDENGVLYLRCKKALYGHIEAARLFYNDLNVSLTEKMGFKRNAYDPCIYNKLTEKGIITVRTHVDDLKVSSKSRQLLEDFIRELTAIYKEITVHRGSSHDYLGMVMTYNKEDQSVTIDMERYIKASIIEFEDENPEVKLTDVVTPAMANLFKTREDGCNKLTSTKATIFHATVAKLLFVAKRGRPDILLAISFLTTRVKAPDDDDWKKLIRVLSYLKKRL